MDEGALTISVPIKPGGAQPLRELLGEIGGDIANNPYLKFSALTTTHFLRWVILDRPPLEEDKEPSYPPQLIFESNYDGPVEAHLDELVRAAGQTMDLIYGNCEGYPEGDKRTIPEITSFLLDHAIPHAVFFRGYPGKTVTEIKQNTAACRRIRSFLDANDARLRTLTTSGVRQELLTHLESEDRLWPPVAPPYQTRLSRLADWLAERRRVAFALLAIGGLALLPLILAAVLTVLVLWAILHRYEEGDLAHLKQVDQAPDDLARQEDHTAQNQVTHVVSLKPWRFRKVVLRTVLWVINLLSRHYFIHGSLGPISSIHYARWVLIDKGNRLLFMSNYDGSWESYLGDFIDLASVGLNAIWSNTRGYPATRDLVNGGAEDEDEFKHWARKRQVPTQVWYSAHPDETVQNILANAAIRQDLQQPVCGERLKQWMSKL
jgi:hypothetical protein